jgi:O-antigen/teichoic acid export membrane protein
MSRAIRSLFRHSSVYGIGTVAGQAAGFLLLPLYTRYLTPADYGIAAIVDVAMSLISTTVGAGVLNTMTRFYHEYDDERSQLAVVSTMFWLMAVIATSVFVGVFCSARWLSTFLFRTPGYADLFNITAGGLALGFLLDTAMLHFVVTNRSTKYVSISLTTLLLQVGFNVWFVVVQGMGIKGIFLSTLVSRAILTVAVSVPTIVGIGFVFSRRLAGRMLAFSFPMIFSTLFRLGGTESDKYFINRFFSPAETGIYAIAAKIGTAIHTLITTSFVRSYNPARFEIMKQPSAQQTYALILDYYLLVITTAGLGLSVFATDIMHLMTTERFYPAAALVPLMVTAWIVFGVRYHFETGILIAKKTRYFAYVNSLTTVLSITLNFFLVARYGLWGALVALNVSQSVTTLLFYWISHRLYPVRYHGDFMVKLAALALFIYAVASFIPTDSVPIRVGAKLLLMGVYVIGLRVAGLLDETVVDYLKRILRLVTTYFGPGLRAGDT